MAVGKGSILRAGSANAAAKEKKQEQIVKESVKPVVQEEENSQFIQAENRQMNVATRVPTEELKEVPRTWGIPQLQSVKLQKLADSMGKFGILVPVVVYKNKKQELLILDGYHRVAVAKESGITELPVFFADVMTDVKARAMFEELRTFAKAEELEKEYEVVSSIKSSMPSYLL